MLVYCDDASLPLGTLGGKRETHLLKTLQAFFTQPSSHTASNGIHRAAALAPILFTHTTTIVPNLQAFITLAG